jgi:hypothetical protein
MLRPSKPPWAQGLGPGPGSLRPPQPQPTQDPTGREIATASPEAHAAPAPAACARSLAPASGEPGEQVGGAQQAARRLHTSQAAEHAELCAFMRDEPTPTRSRTR